MRNKKKICSKLNPFSICKEYSVSLWQCPQFLFFIMGIIIIAVIVSTYFLASSKLRDPFIATLTVLAAGTVLLIINFVITNSFERMAEASKMKTELVSVVSHQLRAPLTNVRFALEFLSSGKEVSTEQSEYYSIIEENSARMNDLVDNLLVVSRIESGNFPLNKKSVSLEDIIKRVVEKFKAYTEASNIKINLDIENKTNNVFTDPLWLEQVVENLLDNAVKYTNGGGKVKITLKQTDGKVNFEIKDQGMGIPQEEQKYVFAKFFRSKNVSKAKTHGSGLGLHIVKKIVELSGGRVGFRSYEGKGTTFYFVLPAIKS